MKTPVFLIGLVFAFACSAGFLNQARAGEYYELETYGYETASHREIELENITSISSDNQPIFSNQILRSSLELTYGISDHWEATAYLDYTKPADDQAEFTAFRTHARTSFFEKGELPIDLGAYFEVEFPRNFRAKDVGFEFRPILEKDFSRWTFRLNPAVELSHVALATGDNAVTVDPDGDVLSTSTQTLSSEKIWLVEWKVSGGAYYHINDRWTPHLDLFQGLTEKSSLVLTSLAMKFGSAIKADLGLGFGLNSNTESRLIVARIELESFLDKH